MTAEQHAPILGHVMGGDAPSIPALIRRLSRSYVGAMRSNMSRTPLAGSLPVSTVIGPSGV